MKKILFIISLIVFITLFISFDHKISDAKKISICPEGTLLFKGKCWLKGRAPGPMSFDQAVKYCADRNMYLPDLKLFKEACAKKKILCYNPKMSYFLKNKGGRAGFYMRVAWRKLHYARCLGDPKKVKKQIINETLCPKDTLPGNNLCWGISQPAMFSSSAVSTWKKTKAYCEKRKGRMPTLKELVAISKSGDGFNNVSQIANGDEIRISLNDSSVWTSTTVNTNKAYSVAFIEGLYSRREYYKPKIIIGIKNKTRWSKMLCVYKPVKKAIIHTK